MCMCFTRTDPALLPPSCARVASCSAPSQPGNKVDIFKHEVVERWRSEEVAEGDIIACVEKGYMMGDAVVRPAKVYASLGPEAANQDEPEPEEAEAAPEEAAEETPPAE